MRRRTVETSATESAMNSGVPKVPDVVRAEGLAFGYPWTPGAPRGGPEHPGR